MKNFIKSLAFTFAAGAFFASCNQDPCKDVVCGDQGQCVEGSCVCNAGYEKDAAGLCNTLMRTKFRANWNAADNCSASGTGNYIVGTSDGTSNVEVRLTNFWGTFTNAVVATVVSTDSISIARQMPDNDSYYVVGGGKINTTTNTITMNYTITDETDPANILSDMCTSTWTR